MFKPENMGKNFAVNLETDISNNTKSSISDLKIDNRDYTWADWNFEKLKEQIEEFQKNIPETEDVCLKLACFGQSVIMHVNEISYQNPNLIYFYGFVDAQKAELIQNISQLNFLLLSQPKLDSKKKPNRIGFKTDV